MDQQDISGGTHVVCSWIFLSSFDAGLNQRRGVRMKMHDKNLRGKSYRASSEEAPEVRLLKKEVTPADRNIELCR